MQNKFKHKVKVVLFSNDGATDVYSPKSEIDSNLYKSNNIDKIKKLKNKISIFI